MTFPLNRHRLWQLAADAALVAAAWWLAFQLRFDSGVPPYYEVLFERTILIVIGIKLAVFVALGFYNRWWRYVSTRDMWRVVLGAGLASIVAGLTVYFVSPVQGIRLPRSIFVMDFLLTLALVAGARLAARTIFERPSVGGLMARGKEVVIVGAGDAGQLVIRELQRNRALGYTPIGIVDDDARKRNLRVHGVRVLGTTDELAHVLRDNRPDELLIAIPSADGEVRRRVVEVARDEGVPVKTLPGLYELIAGDSNLAAQIRPVQVEDVLGRAQVEVDLEEVAAYLSDQTVLVTGAGGLDRLRALPPDLARAPGAARAGRERRDGARSRSSASCSTSAASRPRSRSWPTSATAARCARSSSVTARPSSSTPPRTSTCR